MTPELGVILTIGSLGARYGGPSRTVAGLASALARQGVKVDIVYGHHDVLDGEIVRPVDEGVTLHPTRVWQVKRFRFSPDFAATLASRIRAGPVDLVHDNGLWLPSNWDAWRTARAQGVPYVLSPRGMVEPRALHWRRLLKRAALALYQRRVLEHTSLFFATSTQEYESLRRLGLRQPVAIIPNGIDLEFPESVHGDHATRSPERARVVLFLSRIHPIKGIGNLLQAWASLNTTGWVLRIAGPDEDGYLKEVHKMARQLCRARRVEFLGPVPDGRKRDVYNEADVFVLPSHSENFGVVVAEALAHGLPVITTKGTPWQALEEEGCGWWVDIGVQPLAAALREAMGLSDEQRGAMGRRGQEYARRFSWEAIAGEAAAVYRWVLGRGERPGCVCLD